LVCCVPMVIIAAVLVAIGVVGVGSLVSAFACLAMMAVMMLAMGSMAAGRVTQVGRSAAIALEPATQIPTRGILDLARLRGPERSTRCPSRPLTNRLPTQCRA